MTWFISVSLIAVIKHEINQVRTSLQIPYKVGEAYLSILGGGDCNLLNDHLTVDLKCST